MQVSWIDPKDVAFLAESLRTPPPIPQAADPLGLSLLDPDDVAAVRESFNGWNAPVAETHETHEEDAEPAPEPAQVAKPEVTTTPNGVVSSEVLQQSGPNLDAFRERLQAIRDRAVNAGLLPPAAAPVIQPVATQLEAPAEAPRLPSFKVPSGTVSQRLEAFASWAQHALSTDQIYVVDDLGDLLWGPQDQASLVLSTVLALNAGVRSSAKAACDGPQVIQQGLRSGMTLTVIPCATRLGVLQVAVSTEQGIPAEDAKVVRDALTDAMQAQE